MKSRSWKIVLRLLVTLTVIYLLLVLLAYFFQDKLIFYPGSKPFSSCGVLKKLGARPVTAGPEGKVRFYLRQVPEARAWVLAFHGNAGTVCVPGRDLALSCRIR